MNIVFLGAPGTGKGTIAARLARGYSFTTIAPGNLFREEARNGTTLGKQIKALIDAGTLVPDEITNKLVKRRIADNTVFDGYPRTLNQAEALDSFTNVDDVVLFEMSEDALVERLSGRRVCPVDGGIYHVKTIRPKREGICDTHGVKLVTRDDDRPEIVRKRFRVFREQTAPLIALYEKRGILKRVDASGTPEEVYGKVKGLLEGSLRFLHGK